MKKSISILLVCLLMLILVGCGGGQAAQSTQSTQSAPEAKTEQAAKTEAPAAAEAVPEAPAAAEPEAPAKKDAPTEEKAPAASASPFVGNWRYYAQEGFNGGTTVTHEDVEQYRAQGYGALVNIILSIYDDGTCKMLWTGELDEGTWVDNGDGTASMDIAEKTLLLSMDGDMLLTKADDNISSFERTDQAAA